MRSSYRDVRRHFSILNFELSDHYAVERPPMAAIMSDGVSRADGRVPPDVVVSGDEGDREKIAVAAAAAPYDTLGRQALSPIMR